MIELDPYHQRYIKKVRINKLRIVGSLVVILSLITLLVLYHFPRSQSKGEVLPKQSTTVQQTEKRQDVTTDFAEYYKKAGSKYPSLMAEAVLMTERPRLLAAISVVESDGNFTVRNGGYLKRHHGAWQVNPKWWGPVSYDHVKQALQAEMIIETLLYENNGDLFKALSKYGGDTKGFYATLVLDELKNVPIISMR